MERWSKEWVESIIKLLDEWGNDPYGDYDRMRKELHERQAGGSMTQNESANI